MHFLLICTCLLGGGLSAWSNLPAFELSWQMAGETETCEGSEKDPLDRDAAMRKDSTKTASSKTWWLLKVANKISVADCRRDCFEISV